MNVVLDVLKYLIPVLTIIYAVYLLTRKLIYRDIELKKEELKNQLSPSLLPIRVQAYERMILFLDRMSPHNLIMRVPSDGSAVGFQRMMLEEIRSEFNHNVAQQMYISPDVWRMIVSAKEDLQLLIHESATQLPPEATSSDLGKKILEKHIARETDMIQLAATELKKEFQSTLL